MEANKSTMLQRDGFGSRLKQTSGMDMVQCVRLAPRGWYESSSLDSMGVVTVRLLRSGSRLEVAGTAHRPCGIEAVHEMGGRRNRIEPYYFCYFRSASCSSIS